MEQKLLKLLREINPANTVFIDTSFLIYHLEDIKPYSDITSEIMNNAGLKSSKLFLSTISFTEVLVGILRQNNPASQNTFKNLFYNNPFINIIDFKLEFSETTAQFRLDTNLGLADSIIIATAVKTKSRFLITNDTDFLKAKKLGPAIIILDNILG